MIKPWKATHSSNKDFLFTQAFHSPPINPLKVFEPGVPNVRKTPSRWIAKGRTLPAQGKKIRFQEPKETGGSGEERG